MNFSYPVCYILAMKKGLFSICFLLAVILSNAQSPSFQWAKGIGGTYYTASVSITNDSAGNVYTAGYFYGTTDFDPGGGVFNLTSLGSTDIYISKLDSAGNFLWAKSMGQVSKFARASFIESDGVGNLFITGEFQGVVDFDPSSGIFNLTSNGHKDIFISKFDYSGNFLWAKNIGGTSGSSSNVGLSLAFDPLGNIYTTGYFSGTVDFDSGSGVFSLTSSGGADMFIFKLDSLGDFVWAKKIGGTSTDEAYSIALDTFGNIYTTGFFKDTVDFDPGTGIFNLYSYSFYGEIFISKLDALGNFVWAKQMGGTMDDAALSITLDNTGNIYTTGKFSGSSDFDPGPGSFYLNSAGSYDVYISKLDASGSFVWAKRIGGTIGDDSRFVTLDILGNVYITGYYSGTVDFDPSSGTFNLTSLGDNDVFVSKFDPLGNFVWVKDMPGDSTQYANAIAIDVFHNLYTTGIFYDSVDFNTDAGTFYISATGIYANSFVQKMRLNISVSLANEEMEIDKGISIYPNPTNVSFNIFTSQQIKNGSVEIYNVIGELIFSQKIINQQNTIDLKNQSSGLYFVKVISDGEVIGMKKVVKE